MTTPPSPASNYIITGSTGFETAKACAIIEDSRMEENLLLNDNHVSTKSGELETVVISDEHDDQ